MLTVLALCALPVALIIGPTKDTFRDRTQAPPAGRPPPQRSPQTPRDERKHPVKTAGAADCG
jgi:hypothetical protein